MIFKKLQNIFLPKQLKSRIHFKAVKTLEKRAIHLNIKSEKYLKEAIENNKEWDERKKKVKN